jgi:hypothetical protein
MSNETQCRCEGPQGWCDRHQVFKTEHLVNLCRDTSRPGYWAAWEGGYGPGQKGKRLGDQVARAINTATGGRVKPCGGCKQRHDFLNTIGDAIGIGKQGDRPDRDDG